MSREKEGEPTFTPYLLYRDVAKALEWLASAFGFREHLRHLGANGRVDHAEMRFSHGAIMLGDPGAKYTVKKPQGRYSDMLVVVVSDVDKHFKRAKAAGAKILSKPANEPYGVRSYRANDPWGHRWYFEEHIRHVAPEEWGAVVSEAVQELNSA